MPYEHGPSQRASKQRKERILRQLEEYKNKIDLRSFQKRSIGPERQHVKCSQGTWCALTYESLFGFVEGSDILIGADIKLEFAPMTLLADTKRIWLIQFVNSIMEATATTEQGWAVDRGAGALLPFFGMESRHEPMKLGWDTVRFVKEEWKGNVMAKTGQKVGHNVVFATSIDAPREFCSPSRLIDDGSLTSRFTTYAYDEDNDCWLGGVLWGYTVSLNDNGEPQMKLLDLEKRSNGAPLPEEVETYQTWMTDAPEGRVPISISTKKGKKTW